MSNLNDGKAKKGSKMLMQELINNNQERINNILFKNYKLNDIKWISPLENDNYKEYHLNDKINDKRVYEILKLNDSYEEYPGRGPQYDALGIAKTNNGENIAIFVEAKANIKEIYSKCMSKDSFNRKKIQYEIGNVFNNLGCINDETSEFNICYQLLNRYAYLNHFDNSILVYIYFFNDNSYINVSKLDFSKAIEEEINDRINSKLINKQLEKRVLVIGIDANEIIDNQKSLK